VKRIEEEEEEEEETSRSKALWYLLLNLSSKQPFKLVERSSRRTLEAPFSLAREEEEESATETELLFSLEAQ
jgi:hypothetical protein